MVPTRGLSFDLPAAVRREGGPLADLGPDALAHLAEDYLRFLALVKAQPQARLIPFGLLDEVWHLHMLHPEAYRRDCEALVGWVVDHDPGFGNAAEEAEALAAAEIRTREAWDAMFGREGHPMPVATTTKCSPVPQPPPPPPHPEPHPRPEPQPEPEPEEGHGRARALQALVISLVQGLRRKGSLADRTDAELEALARAYGQALAETPDQGQPAFASGELAALWRFHMQLPVAYARDSQALTGRLVEPAA